MLFSNPVIGDDSHSTRNVQLLELRKRLLANDAAQLRATVRLHAHAADDQLPQLRRVSRRQALQQSTEHVVAVVVYASPSSSRTHKKDPTRTDSGTCSP